MTDENLLDEEVVVPVEEEAVNVPVPAPVVEPEPEPEPEPTPEPTLEPVVEPEPTPEPNNQLRIEVKKEVSSVSFPDSFSFPATIAVEDLSGNIISAKPIYRFSNISLLTPPKGSYKLSLSDKDTKITTEFTVE